MSARQTPSRQTTGWRHSAPEPRHHSLSIEGYSVTPDLVERVRSGDWDPEHRQEDREERDALAARGYWQAFQRVKASVSAVLGEANPGAVARDAHREWYRELFQPFVARGMHAMPTLFELLENEPAPSARAVLGHWLIGYIHPYPDGNGRIARFLMNVMLAAGGYPWTVIRVEDSDPYLAALEAASVESDIRPFARLLAERVRWSFEKTRA